MMKFAGHARMIQLGKNAREIKIFQFIVKIARNVKNGGEYHLQHRTNLKRGVGIKGIVGGKGEK